MTLHSHYERRVSQSPVRPSSVTYSDPFCLTPITIPHADHSLSHVGSLFFVRKISRRRYLPRQHPPRVHRSPLSARTILAHPLGRKSALVVLAPAAPNGVAPRDGDDELVQPGQQVL